MYLKSIFFISLTSIFVGCANDTYVNSDKTIKKNLVNQKIEKKITYKPAITTTQYKSILKEQSIDEESTSINMNKALLDFYKEWKGTRYKFGGNSKRGIDCSAFTQRIYKEKFNIKIPRNTRTQVKVGIKIKRSELELGDLVFFKTGKYDRHVGIYMENGEFMHASIKGVKFTKLDKPYYVKRYWTSRRILY